MGNKKRPQLGNQRIEPAAAGAPVFDVAFVSALASTLTQFALPLLLHSANCLPSPKVQLSLSLSLSLSLWHKLVASKLSFDF